MRISRDKLNKLAHTVADTLAEIDEVGFLEDRNTIRQEARKALEALLTQEAGIDTAARLKIASQRKIILEGSQEWEILYRKYYNDEAGDLKRLRAAVRHANTGTSTSGLRTVVDVQHLSGHVTSFCEINDSLCDVRRLGESTHR